MSSSFDLAIRLADRIELGVTGRSGNGDIALLLERGDNPLPPLAQLVVLFEADRSGRYPDRALKLDAGVSCSLIVEDHPKPPSSPTPSLILSLES